MMAIPEGYEVVSNIPEGYEVVDQPQQAAPAKPSPTEIYNKIKSGYPGAGFIEPATTIATGIAGSAVGGLAGLGNMMNPFSDTPSADIVKQYKDALTVQPWTDQGKASMKDLGDLMQEDIPVIDRSVMDMANATGEAFGESGAQTLEMLGQDPALGYSLGRAMPEALGMALGTPAINAALKPVGAAAKGVGRGVDALVNRNPNKLISQAAPSAKSLKTTASNIFDELDNSGAVINADKITNLSNDLVNITAKKGYHPKLQPSVKVALDEFAALNGQNVPVGKLNQLREFATASASNIGDPKTKMLGTIMLKKIDETMEGLKASDFSSGGINAGQQYKKARELWGRSKRSEMITDAVSKAENAASGTENGIRIEIRKILRNDKKRAFFNKDELSQMRKIADGDFKGNLAKAIGKFGFDIGKSTNTVGGAIGAVGGSMINPIAAVTIPAVGTASRALSKYMTKNNAKMADAIIRAGTDGKKIAREYMKRVPKKDWNPDDLSSLFINSKASIDGLRKMPLKISSKKQKSFIAESILAADALNQINNNEN